MRSRRGEGWPLGTQHVQTPTCSPQGSISRSPSLQVTMACLPAFSSCFSCLGLQPAGRLSGHCCDLGGLSLLSLSPVICKMGTGGHPAPSKQNRQKPFNGCERRDGLGGEVVTEAVLLAHTHTQDRSRARTVSPDATWRSLSTASAPVQAGGTHCVHLASRMRTQRVSKSCSGLLLARPHPWCAHGLQSDPTEEGRIGVHLFPLRVAPPLVFPEPQEATVPCALHWSPGLPAPPDSP